MHETLFVETMTALMPTMYRVSCMYLSSPHDREDAVQEALHKAWEKRAQLRDETLIKTWMIRILINECRNIQRKKKNFALWEECVEPVCEDTEREERLLLRTALFSLSEKERMPLVLHYIEGYGVEQVAKMLRLPAGTVKSRMRKGREHLRELLQEEVFGE
ncbi:MAG: RNA polymerase sigma factor [Clostridia bacterium]|nr:RNA polymerase sigma factor [Clostridia bacterium]